MYFEEIKFQSEVPTWEVDRKTGRLLGTRRPVTVTLHRATDGVKATPWAQRKLKTEEKRGNDPASAEKLWERGSVFSL